LKAEPLAEVLKLAQLLGTEPEELAYLEKVPPADLRRLRELAADSVYGSSSDALQRVAAANRVLPTKVLASIAQRALGPVITAQLSSMIPPGRAVEVAERLPTPFLADVAVAMDPRSASEVIAGIPARRIADITKELLAREEYVTMGMFVGHLSDRTLLATFPIIGDADLLRVAFVIDEKERLDRVVGLLPEERLEDVVEAAAADGLEAELEALYGSLDPVLRERLAPLAERQRAARSSGSGT
jgi:hypothetical protein